MGNYINRSAAALLTLASLGYCASVHAAPSLLSADDEAQLASWLGEGKIQLTNIYTKATGDTSVDFHAAVDGKGRNFAVMQATNAAGQTWLVGGYDPQSWSSSGKFNITDAQSTRTAFLFNLTDRTKHVQVPASYVVDSWGSYQTLNHPDYGPAFGLGNDLAVTRDLTHGVSLMYSYMDESGSNYYRSLLDNSLYTSPNVTFGAIEIYSISAVPEPTPVAMLLAGIGMLTWQRRRRR